MCNEKHFSVKVIHWLQPKIIFINLHSDLLDRCVYITLNILINILIFFKEKMLFIIY